MSSSLHRGADSPDSPTRRRCGNRRHWRFCGPTMAWFGRREGGTMARGIFRLRLPDGTVRLARGTPETGPTDLLPDDTTVESLLHGGPSGLAEAVAATATGDAVPAGATLLAPIDTQEVWGAGVTYERSRVARMEEAVEPSIYDRVYDAVRPEVFFKAVGWRVRGPAESITVRADSG